MARRFWKRTKKDIWIIRFVALTISIILWIMVMGGKKVSVTKTATLDYQLPPHLMLANQPPVEVSIRVVGLPAFIEEFDRQRRVIPINLTKSSVGDVEIKLEDEIFKLPLGVTLESVSPRLIPLKIGVAITKRVPVRAVIGNRLPEGVRLTSITTRPSTIEIRGPESRLQSIESVKTDPITVSPNSLRQDFEVSLNTKELPGIQFGDQLSVVSVTVQVEGSFARKWFRKIPIRVKIGDTKLTPKDRRIRVAPPVVDFLLEGPQRVLRNFELNDFDIWAEVTELKQGRINARIDWSLPPELRVVQLSHDIVEVSINP